MGGLGYRSTASPAGADTELDRAFAIAIYIYLAEARLVKANPLKPVVASEVEEPKASRWGEGTGRGWKEETRRLPDLPHITGESSAASGEGRSCCRGVDHLLKPLDLLMLSPFVSRLG